MRRSVRAGGDTKRELLFGASRPAPTRRKSPAQKGMSRKERRARAETKAAPAGKAAESQH
jgi:hypothetical protein